MDKQIFLQNVFFYFIVQILQKTTTKDGKYKKDSNE